MDLESFRINRETVKPRNRETLGIIAGEESEFPPFGKQTFFFQDMAAASVDLPTDIFVFSPLWWEGAGMIRGFRFDGDQWHSGYGLIPQAIYDRFTPKAPGEKEAYLNFRSYLLERGHWFINPLPLVELTRNKVWFHEFLEIKGLPTLPAVMLNRITADELDRFFAGNGTVYIKPVIGSNGARIATIERMEDGHCLVRQPERVERRPFAAILTYLRTNWPADEFFIQPKANLIPYGQRAYDVRVLVQNHGRRDYRVTGLGVRFGGKGSWVSNLSAGGSALPLSYLQETFGRVGVAVVELEEEIKNACLHCTSLLHDQYGDFAEMAYDLLLTTDRGPIFLEANAKPARWIFTVIADALEKEDPVASGYYQEVRMESVRLPLLFVARQRMNFEAPGEP